MVNPLCAEDEKKNYINFRKYDHSVEVIAPGGRLNIKMSSYQYRDPHVKDKTVLRPSYL